MAASFSNELVVSGSPEVEVKGLTDHVIQNLILQHMLQFPKAISTVLTCSETLFYLLEIFGKVFFTGYNWLSPHSLGIS